MVWVGGCIFVCVSVCISIDIFYHQFLVGENIMKGYAVSCCDKVNTFVYRV